MERREAGEVCGFSESAGATCAETRTTDSEKGRGEAQAATLSGMVSRTNESISAEAS